MRKLVIATAAAVLAAVGGLVASGPAHAIQSPQAVTVSYSASAYQAEAAEAAEIWNSAVPNLQMVEGEADATIVIAGTNGGGSRAYPCGLGCAQILIDSQDVAAGHSALRIVAHEIGHGHTLPDNDDGDCDILMSGGIAGTSCGNPNPRTSESAQVNAAYGGGQAVTDDLQPDIYEPSAGLSKGWVSRGPHPSPPDRDAKLDV